MSEYQYCEFVAIDRPLSKDEMAELRFSCQRRKVLNSAAEGIALGWQSRSKTKAPKALLF
jgi:hypothetical protein